MGIPFFEMLHIVFSVIGGGFTKGKYIFLNHIDFYPSSSQWFPIMFYIVPWVPNVFPKGAP
jgi:hypothetical protein